MNISQVEKNIENLISSFDKENFIFDFLLAYGQPASTITLLKKGDYNRSKNPNELLLKNKVLFNTEQTDSMYHLIDEKKKDIAVVKYNPRFLITTDYSSFLAVDTKIGDTLDIELKDLIKHYDFFLPLAGMEKEQIQSENLADIKAAEKMGKLYDIILRANQFKDELDRRALNVFFSRLLFCFFAEDTSIFSEGQFSNAVASHTSKDGLDLKEYLEKLFFVLSSEDRFGYPQFLQDFPYVNGGLFEKEYPIPNFGVKARELILECGSLNWRQINPDIFGSMMQAIVHSKDRSNLGMHYTSVSNIMKVIEPLFLNDFKEELKKAGTSEIKLKKLLQRIYNLKIFDPACGSGNFLIIAYKELCRLEIEIFKKITTQKSFNFMSDLKLTQFYGIEIDDFAHETARLSLWLTQHQMNVCYNEIFQITRPTLPLQAGGRIVHGNAARIDWEEICSKEESDEIYILGNPPYLGSSLQSKQQKEEMSHVFKGIKGYKNLDYIACWFLKAAKFSTNSNISFAFVSTNSICQGEQVALLWPHILKSNLEIQFAYKSFRWNNSAKNNAGVSCVIIGIAKKNTQKKILYIGNSYTKATYINAYLSKGGDLYIYRRSQSISSLPQILRGDTPTDGGNFILLEEEKNTLLQKYPKARKFIRALVGSADYLKGFNRWCIWVQDKDYNEAKGIEGLEEIFKKVQKFRKQSKAPTTRDFEFDYKFRQIQHKETNAIVIPRVSSERRPYIPCGFVETGTIILDSAQAIYDPETYIFSIISSHMHMIWVRTLGGRLETRLRYSSALCYNTFPFPRISKKQKTILEEMVFNILDIRENYSELNLATLYDPDKMPKDLREAHHVMDIEIEKCYRKDPFKNDTERLQQLFKLYQQMVEEEKRGGQKCLI